jgi:hypothetical protein
MSNEEENENPAPCEHEWEETGGHIEHSANHLSVLYFTHYKCKHCAETKSVLDEVHDH